MCCKHKRDSQRWFEEALKQAGFIDFCGTISGTPSRVG